MILSECQEDGTYICGLDICQFCSVKFFLGEGVLVSLDPVLLVVLDGGKSNDALLGVVTRHFDQEPRLPGGVDAKGIASSKILSKPSNIFGEREEALISSRRLCY